MQETPATSVKPRLRGVTHHAAAFVFPVMGAVLVAVADTGRGRVAAAVYTVCVTAMYATSAVYHRGSWSPEAKARLRRADHSTILLCIAGTYTPMAAVGVGGATGARILWAVWILAVAGIAVRNLWLTAPRWLVSGVYLVVGWVALIAIPALLHHLGGTTFGLVIGGGVAYSLGAVVYATKKPDPDPAVFGFHEVFHALTVVAGLLFYAAAWRVVA